MPKSFNMIKEAKIIVKENKWRRNLEGRAPFVGG